MKYSSDLYDLIKSLSMNEKRNFKLFAQNSSTTKSRNYIPLFEILDKMKTYNEDILVEKFKKENKLSQLHPMKAYLFKVIMKSLSKYHSEKSNDYELKSMITNALILKEKELKVKSKKILNQAKEIAIKYENFDVLLEIYSHLAKESLGKEKRDFLSEKSLILKKIANILTYEKVIADLGVGKALANRQEAAKKALLFPLLQKEEQALSITAKHLFHHIKSICFYGLKEEEKTLEHLKKRRFYLAWSDEILKANSIDYLRCAHNIIALQSLLKNYQEANQLLDELLVQLDKKNFFTKHIQSIIFNTYAISKLDLIIQTGDFTDSTSIVLKIEEQINQYKNQLTTYNLALIYLNIAVIYFGKANYKSALTWINKALNFEKENINTDFIVFAKLFNMVIHYERENHELIFNLERSLKRSIGKEGRVFEAEKILIRFFRRKIPKINNENTRLIFKELQEELLDIFNDKKEANLLRYFDFLSWTESKIQNRSFEDIVREKAERQ